MSAVLSGYFGSKARMLKVLDNYIKPLLQSGKNKLIFGDLFAGTGLVGSHYASLTKKVVSSDQELYSYVLSKAMLQTVYTSKLQRLIIYLNKLKPVKGLIYKYFSPNKQGEISNQNVRMFFTCENAMKMDAIRIEINRMFKSKKITYKEFVFLLGSLMHTTSKYANCAANFRAYLKQFNPRSSRNFVLVPIHTNHVHYAKHSVIKNDCLKVARHEKLDIVYLDPPYSNTCYGSYYSFYNYLCMYNKNVILKGIAGVVSHYNKSSFGAAATSRGSFNKLFKTLARGSTKYIIMSYNSNGMIKKNEFVKMLMTIGSVKLLKMWSLNFKTHSNVRENKVIEYIFIVNLKDTKRSFYESWIS